VSKPGNRQPVDAQPDALHHLGRGAGVILGNPGKIASRSSAAASRTTTFMRR
jgi:hypothetical protein